uniref:Bifunctional protein FolD n=1 Tax=Schistocephalus solidus TaxID=70667 RepID=A0A0V0JCP7_SCHSO
MSSLGNVICGKSIARKITSAIGREIRHINAERPFTPTLAVLQVGDDPASSRFIKVKTEAALACGIAIKQIKFPVGAQAATVIQQIKALNEDDSVHGILFQLPPDFDHSVPVEAILEAIHPAKDVDGLTPLQAYRLHNGDFMKIMKKTRRDGFGDDPASSVPMYLPCAPAACLHLLRQVGLDLDTNLRCLVIGYGHLVGSPLTSLLLHATKMTVTVCREFTQCLQDEVARADVIVAAAGVPGLVRGEWIRPGAIVLDCGVNITPQGNTGSGSSFLFCFEPSSLSLSQCWRNVGRTANFKLLRINTASFRHAVIPF